METGKPHKIAWTFREIVGLAAMAIMALGLLIFVGQVLHWLKQGNWTPYSVWLLLDDLEIRVPDPHTNWVGLQEIIDWLMRLVLFSPASVAVMCLGAFIGWLARAKR
jgi:hypothetical protein